ncbi:YdcF family protein [Alteromonas oceani]|uniref:YdcF family protein n=1 Tax=Alteromonas oceani TaxID=2071609 RepID=A0ABV7K4M6_9ALTE|nr:ElyC/SanA/YdcF family protein [Alteromonas oceani]
MDVDTLKFIVKQLISPVVLFFVLLLAALACHYSNKLSRYTYLIFISGFTWLLLASQYTFSNWLLAPLEYAYPPVKKSDKAWHHVEYIFTPGCYYYGNDLPEASNWHQCSLTRLTQTAIMSVYKNKPVIVTGGHFLEDKDISYAERARAFLSPLISAPVTALPAGFNTEQELQALFNLTGDVPIAVVTSATHMRRLVYQARQIGFHHLVPVPVEHLSPPTYEVTLNIPSIASIYHTERALYEYIGLLYETGDWPIR